ncbi:MAG: MoaD/ThiS family protein [Candidatus Hodarchaeales archaeon]
MTITITVELMGSLRRPAGKRKFQLEIDDNLTIQNLLSELNFSAEESRYLLAYIGLKEVKSDYILKDGDSVFITALVGGG